MLRRNFLTLAVLGVGFGPTLAFGQTSEIWSADETFVALERGEVVLLDIRSRKEWRNKTFAALERGEGVLLDIRSRKEWRNTGVAKGAWPISMHEPRFPQRLFAAKELAKGKPVAIICATGGRTGSVMRALRRSGYSGFIDVSEGMMGSRLGRGWIAKKYPITKAGDALASLPKELE